MNFWKIVFVFLLFFACFLYFSERMLEKTIQQTIQLEQFTNWCKSNNDKNLSQKTKKVNKTKEKIIKTQCESYFNTTPYYLYDGCKKDIYKTNSKTKKPKNKNPICQQLIENGWNTKWTKKDLQRWKKINSKNMTDVKKARDNIRKNIGHVSEEQITICFPKYI
jgi:hypothetical protein